MAFMNFNTFQKNRRLWMALVLMICMVSFVFCTGAGDMAEQIQRRFGGGRSGVTIGSLDGRNITSRELHELKIQRNVANIFMKSITENLFKGLSKKLFDQAKNPGEVKDEQERRRQLTQMAAVRDTLGERKARPRYFDIDVKFDDLLEFRLWQAEADRLGIKLEEGDLDLLVQLEFFRVPLENELFQANQAVQRETRDVSPAFVRRAIGEEFRVRMAQYAVMGAQPFSYYTRGVKSDQGLTLKFTDPGFPDEIRAPMTMAQIWDFYKDQRSEFDVALIPIDVKQWVGEIKDPDAILRKAYFEDTKNKPYEPGAEDSGIEIPPQSTFEYVYADPMSPAYLDLAKTVARLKLTNPVPFDTMQSPLVTATRYMAVAQKHQDSLQRELDAMVSKVSFRREDLYRGAALHFEKDFASPILGFYAGHHPEAVTSLIGSFGMAPMEGAMTAQAHMAGFLAWGAVKHPEEVEAALLSEAKRRTPVYSGLLGWGFSDSPLHLAAPYLAMDRTTRYPHPTFPSLILVGYVHPTYTVETLQRHLEDKLARRTAEEWAQENMLVVRQALEKAAGDPDKIRRELNKYVSVMNLTHGPKDELKGNYYNRYTINDAKEFEILKKGYSEYMDMINLFEGRDLTPARVLKADDYYKVYFDSAESFSATTLNRAVPWPPLVKPNSVRIWKREADPRLINAGNVKIEERLRLDNHLAQIDPNLQAPNLDLFKTAAKPILFWRTGDINATRPSDYNKIGTDLQGIAADLKKVAVERKNAGNDVAKLEELRLKEAALRKSEADLKGIETRITEGWKFAQARTTKALPRAQEVATKLIEKGNPTPLIESEAATLKREVIKLVKLSKLQADNTDFMAPRTDYYPPTLPAEKLAYPRDDMMQQILGLYDLKAPISVGFKELDDANKKLFELASKEQQPKGKYVQILTNKPRSVFYVAAITAPPNADKELFSRSISRAGFANIGGFRDFFVDRAQEQTAKRLRADFILTLQQAHNFSITNADARKEFDDRASGD